MGNNKFHITFKINIINTWLYHPLPIAIGRGRYSRQAKKLIAIQPAGFRSLNS